MHIDYNRIYHTSDDELEAFGFTPQTHGKISNIKALRSICSGMGLAEAKQAIETIPEYDYRGGAFFDRIRNLIAEHYKIGPFSQTLSDEQIMGYLEEAVKVGGDIYFLTPFQAIRTWITNTRNNGGLEHLAREERAIMNKL